MHVFYHILWHSLVMVISKNEVDLCYQKNCAQMFLTNVLLFSDFMAADGEVSVCINVFGSFYF